MTINTDNNSIKTKRLNDFEETLKKHNLMLLPVAFETLWVNITNLCNQACTHCHLDASPKRNEQMDRITIDRCLKILKDSDSCRTLDITGGEPELHPDFTYFVTGAREHNKNVTVRHNLTVIIDGNPMTGESMEYLPEFFAENQVEILGSLPYFREEETDRVRGSGAFRKSIRSIRLLNEHGYSGEESGLVLNLVYNYSGPLRPDDQAAMESEFRRRLKSDYGVSFNRLFTVTNMPINRFRRHLEKSGNYDGYINSLKEAFSDSAASLIACRSLISVDYTGSIYDCDFNLALGLQIGEKEPLTVFNLDIASILNRKIRFGPHCFGCTAGGGSS
jgi:radical SAM/Cys-rich protein